MTIVLSSKDELKFMRDNLLKKMEKGNFILLSSTEYETDPLYG
jgi:hypothetical protein